MLIEFRVQNYRSIREEQALSLVAAKDSSHADTHVVPTGLKTIPGVLKSAVLYGANASGKTNFLKAVEFMRNLVAQSATIVQLGETLNIQSFRLDNRTINEPSEFEITFLEAGIRYQYGFRATTERIHEEWLFVHKTSKPQQWFSRKYNLDTNSDEYDFGSHFTGQRKLWQESTRPNGLFLSTAVHLNNEQLKPIFNWIVNNLVVMTSTTQLMPDYSIRMLKDNVKKQEIEKFMISADISITNISVVEKKGYAQSFSFNSAGSASNLKNEEIELLSPQFEHETPNGAKTNFEYGDESHGIQKLFCFSGPILDILNSGRVLVIDELDSGLHPLLVKYLINIFHDPKLNSKGAQLIFTMHNTALLDKSIFRRDQVWFVEKSTDQATTLYPLTDFSPRKNEAIENGYLIGRYGAVPFFGDLDL